MDIEGEHIGRRVREIRAWREMNLTALAGLAGMSAGYLSRIERGERPVTKRSTLEALAQALRVSPTELTGQPWTPVDSAGADARSALAAMETALETFELGTDPGVAIRDWPAIETDLAVLVKHMHWTADYAAQGQVAPRLLGELHAAYVRAPQHRRGVLIGLMKSYSSAMWTTKRLGGLGLPLMAARAVQQCAEALGDPVWLAYAAWLRGDAGGQLNRPAHYQRSVAAAETLTGLLNNADAVQAYGMCHLSAALAASVQGDLSTADTHLAEATAIAGRMDDEVGGWAHLWFGRTNVGVWKTSIGVEIGDTGRAIEAAKEVHPDSLPGTSRQAEFWADLGRALIAEPRSREKGLAHLLRAEQLAPQRIRNDVFVREAVADELRRARRDAGSRELRGLAWRMGVAPTG